MPPFASIVIPAHGRPELLKRAFDSVLACQGSDTSEIIIVDDGSTPPLACPYLREQDRLIRLGAPHGAAAARNRGIDAATGLVIHLLDSDDRFLERDFSDTSVADSEHTLFYTDVKSQGFRSSYPSAVTLPDFIPSILHDHPHICQTSSLYFPRRLGLHFDESLPKHQDWDLVLTALSRGLLVSRGPGLTFFDRSDRLSLSRRTRPDLSQPWYRKLQDASCLPPAQMELVHFFLFCTDPATIPLPQFLLHGCRHLAARRITPRKLAIFAFRRVIVSTGRGRA